MRKACYFTITILSFWLLSLSCLNSPSVELSPEQARLVDQGDLWQEIQAIKQVNPEAMFGASDESIEAYRILFQRFSSIDPDWYLDEVARDLSNDPELLLLLEPRQVDSWQSLVDLSRGRIQISWNRSNMTPDSIIFGIQLNGSDGVLAKRDLDSKLISHIANAFSQDGNTGMVLENSETYTTDDGFGGGESSEVLSWRYSRVWQGLPVFDDFIVLSIRTSDWDHRRWVGSLLANWRRDILLQNVIPSIDTQAAEAIALASFSGNPSVTRDGVRFGIMHFGGNDLLVYVFQITDDQGQPWMSYVSGDGVIVRSDPQWVDYDGTLQVKVSRPYDTEKSLHALPYAKVFEDDTTEVEYTGCEGQSDDLFAGNSMSLLGSSDYSGMYSGLLPSDPLDTIWSVDLRGAYAYDRSLGADGVISLPTFSAGGVEEFSWTDETDSYSRSRRSEVFYLLNYIRQLHNTTYYGVPTWAPLPFDYHLSQSCCCQEPYSTGNCCSGASYGGCIQVVCGDTMLTEAAPSVERRLRNVVFHEFSHESRPAAGAGYCGCGEEYPTKECRFWEEGRADLGALVASKFESARLEYQPSLLYPDDIVDTCGYNIYQSASVFEAIYADYVISVGIGCGMKDIHTNITAPQMSTYLVGTCTDSDGDGIADVLGCSNSFYKYLYLGNTSNWLGQYQRTQEIGRAFHAHVTDADRFAAGIQSFPWPDDLPNHYRQAAFLDVESGGTKVINQGIYPGSGTLRLDTPSDYDSAMFFGRAGETYYIQTRALAAGVDTYLQVLNRNGQALASNDDCDANPRSCLYFSPSTSDFYRIRVFPVAGSMTGPSKTYEIAVWWDGDDAADTYTVGSPLPTNGIYRNGVINTTSDKDVYKIVSSASQTLQYKGCSDYGMSVTTKLLGSTGRLLDTYTATACNSADRNYSVARGTYYLSVESTAGVTGNYSVKASLAGDIDIDSLSLNAWPLAIGSNGGVLTSSDFAGSSDCEDWYYFSSSQEGRLFTIETFMLGGAVDTRLEVYAPETTIFGRKEPAFDSKEDTSGESEIGHWMVMDDDGANGSVASRVSFLTPIVGDYYIRVVNKSCESTGSYALLLEDAGASAGWYSYP